MNERLPSCIRTLTLWTCCGQRTIPVDVSADELSGEAWRLARCLITTDRQHRDAYGDPADGVRVLSLRTEGELASAAGWSPEYLAKLDRTYPGWRDRQQIIDWRFQPFHVWPDHRHGPHQDPEPEQLHLLALAYLQGEAARIAAAGGTVIASGDFSVRLVPDGADETVVLIPHEQGEARAEAATRALFGYHPRRSVGGAS